MERIGSRSQLPTTEGEKSEIQPHAQYARVVMSLPQTTPCETPRQSAVVLVAAHGRGCHGKPG
jgi:hypothetical protein